MWLQTKMLTLLFKSLQTFLRASPLRSFLWAITASSFSNSLQQLAPSPNKLSMGFVPEPKCASFLVNSALKFVPFLPLLETIWKYFVWNLEIFFYKTPSHDFKHIQVDM